jgi:hypothetical protein
VSTRTTIALGVVFVALLTAFIFTGQRERRIQREEFESRRLFDVAATDIVTMSIQRRGHEAVEAVRTEDGGWEFTGQHRRIPVNGPLWDQLAEVMTLATNERPIPGGGEKDLESFGLAPPELTVVVGTRQGVARQLDFGGLEPTQRHRYVQTPEDGIFLTTAELFSIMNRTLAELRDRRLFRNLSEGLAKLEYKRYIVSTEDEEGLSDDMRERTAGIDDVYVKDASGPWRLASPVEARARQDRLEALERVLPSLGGRAFIDDPEDLSDYGLDQPFARMTVYGSDGTGDTLLLGGIDAASTADGEAGLYVKHDDGQTVVVVDARLFNLLPDRPEAFRERRLFTGEAAALRRIEYTDPSHEIVLESEGEGWQLVEPAGAETDQIAVSMYIAQLKHVEGRTFPAGITPDAFGSSRVSIDYTFEDGATSQIEVGAPVPGTDPLTFYARQDFGEVTTISFDDFQTLQATPFDFFDKSLVKFDPESLDSFELVVDDNRLVFTQSDGRWSVSEPADRRVIAQADVDDFLSALTQVQLRGRAEPAPAEEVTGTATPIVSLTLQVLGERVGPIHIGRLKSGGSRQRFTTVSGRPGVYFVDQSLVDAARLCASSVDSAN